MNGFISTRWRRSFEMMKIVYGLLTLTIAVLIAQACLGLLPLSNPYLSYGEVVIPAGERSLERRMARHLSDDLRGRDLKTANARLRELGFKCRWVSAHTKADARSMQCMFRQNVVVSFLSRVGTAIITWTKNDVEVAFQIEYSR